MAHVEDLLILLMITAGTLSFVVGWGWLAVRGFRENLLWGLVTTVFPVLAAPCFALNHWKLARLPMVLLYGGMLSASIGGRLMPPFC
jgi:hypothetical protein